MLGLLNRRRLREIPKAEVSMHERDENAADDRGKVRAARERPNTLERAVRAIKKRGKLWALYERLLGARRKLTDDELGARYEYGTIVHEAMSDQRVYGSDAVNLLARVIGMSPSSLYCDARVVTVFPPDRFADLRRRHNYFGVPLTYSHLVVLAGVKPSTRREQLLARSYAEGWTVKELKAEVSSAPKSVATSDPAKTIDGVVQLGALARKAREDLADAYSALASEGENQDRLERLSQSEEEFRTLADAISSLRASAARKPAKAADGMGLWGARRGNG
jgi:hypothetical protein